MTRGEMFAKFGITEWPEKERLLSNEEKQIVAKILETGIETPEEQRFIDILKMPYPKFIPAYYETYYENSIKLYSQPDFAYKMFLLNGTETDAVNTFIKNDIIVGKCPRIPLKELGENPLRSIFWSKKNLGKLVYILQYVDKAEAMRLGLAGDSTFYDAASKSFREEGFNLAGKINVFNEAEREILIRYLGLNHADPMSIKTISDELHIPLDLVQKFISSSKGNYVEYLLKSTDELKNKLKCNKGLKTSKGFRLYYYEPFKDLDFKMNCHYIQKNKLSDIESKVAEKNTHASNNIVKDLEAYFATMYMFDTPKDAADYLVVSIQTFIQRLENIKTQIIEQAHLEQENTKTL